MQSTQHNINAFIQEKHAILPIIDNENSEDILPIIDALNAGNIHAVEITLRNQAGFESIALARKHFPSLRICAGTVTSIEDIKTLSTLAVDFIISPGCTRELLSASQDAKLDLLPGVATPSDILMAKAFGLSHFKFFPAALMGGTAMLKALSGPFNDVQFCATGGINQHNFIDYLQLDNVFSIGGSWLVTQDDIRNQHWNAITEKAKAATDRLTEIM